MRRSLFRTRRYVEPPRLSAEERARLDGWVAHLDVDLELAQATLRLPVADLPPVPTAAGSEPAAPAAPAAPPPNRRLRGAYARRAARADG